MRQIVFLFLLASSTITWGQKAEVFFKTALKYYQHEDFSSALENFDKAIELKADYADAYAYRGDTKLLMNNYSGASDDIEEAIHLDPKNSDAYCFRGKIKFMLEEYEASLTDFNRAIQLSPTDQHALFYRARTYYMLNREEEALKDVNALIFLNPEKSQNYLLRSDIYRSQKKWELGLEDAKKSLSIDPTQVYALLNRAYFYWELKQEKKAFEDINKLIAMSPNLAPAYTARGYFYGFKNETEKAKLDFQKATELDRKEAYNFYQLARTNWNEHNYGTALTQIEKCIKLDSTYLYSYMIRGNSKFRLCYVEMIRKIDAELSESETDEALETEPELEQEMTEDELEGRIMEPMDEDDLELLTPTDREKLAEVYQSSIQDINRCIASEPDSVNGYTVRFEINYLMSNFEEALLDCNKILELDDTATQYRIARIEILMDFEEYELAEKDIQFIMKSNVENASYLFYIAEQKRYADDFEGALELLDACLLAQPENTEFLHARGIVYYRLGRKKESCQDFSKSVSLGNEGSLQLKQKVCVEK